MNFNLSNTFPYLKLEKVLVENTRLPVGSTHIDNGGYTSTKFQPFTSCNDTWYFLNHQHNWTNMYLWQYVPRNVRNSDISTLSEIQNLTNTPSSLQQLQSFGDKLSNDYQDVKNTINKLNSVNEEILDEIKKQMLDRTNNLPSISERFEKLQNQIEKLTKAQEEQQKLLFKMAGALLPMEGPRS